jgi:HlyD family secretion protein
VYVFDAAAARIHLRSIEPGLRNWEYVEVRNGLSEGDRVVTTVDREGLAEGVEAREEKVLGP